MTDELYKRYRPTKFSEVIGQREALSTIIDMGKAGTLPHFLLLSGPSGTGKTTIARILRRSLKCSDLDYVEVNASDTRGIDTVREIMSRMGVAPMGGETRIWCIDESHNLTKDAQHSFLKALEDTPRHVYFIFCTTEPKKLLPTIVTRATEIQLRAVTDADVATLVRTVSIKEGAEVDPAVAAKVAEVSFGSPRKALVLLHQIIALPGKDAQLMAIEKPDFQANAIEIARKLLDTRTTWADMCKLFEKVQEVADDPEQLRWMVLGYAKAVLKKTANRRAAWMIDCFRDNFYDSKDAGFIVSCYNVIKGGAK